jgi:hypothetical protein
MNTLQKIVNEEGFYKSDYHFLIYETREDAIDAVKLRKDLLDLDELFMEGLCCDLHKATFTAIPAAHGYSAGLKSIVKFSFPYELIYVVEKWKSGNSEFWNAVIGEKKIGWIIVNDRRFIKKVNFDE